MKRHTLISASILLSAACATRIPPPQTPARGAADPDRAWANHLSRFVDDKGRMDYAGMAKDSADLDTYLTYIAKVSPESEPSKFPTMQAKLAFDINAYNALAMYDVLKSNFPPNLNDVKVTFFYKNRFALGGRDISLYALENQVIRPMGDPRVHVALNCMARGCPRLPREPFTAEGLDGQLDRQAREFFNDPRHVELQPDKKTVRFSQILQFYTEDFLKKAPSLIAYANLYRDEKIPADWKVDFIPYDWVLNKQ
jgi:uncharacterized protein DUF547